MQLDDIRVGVLRRIVEIYRSIAYFDAEPSSIPAPPELPGDETDPLTTTLGALTEETLREGDQASRRYSLRLGNPRYPFMKIVLQEHLVVGEFFFEIDTHDQMFELEGEEAQRFETLRRYNLDVKERVEQAWTEAGLPTAAQIKGLVEGRLVRRAPSKGRHILLVDDDRAIAATLALLLEAGGYEVTVLNDGREAVAQADPELHDLVLMDNEMVHVNGFEACRMLKAAQRTARLPVLIATAGALTLQQLDAADGFMVKPFRMELLFSILDDMLRRRATD